jgi:hypothetical protein
MVSAVIAGFFYLRLVLIMVSNPGATGDGLAWDDGSPEVEADKADYAATGDTSWGGRTVSEPQRVATLEPVAASEFGPAGSRPVVPLSVSTGIVICSGFTVLFGVWPSPIINFAHAATLLLH